MSESRRSKSNGFSDFLTQIGPMARYVDDLMLLLPIISGPDGEDPSVVPMPLGKADAVELRRLRVMFHADNGILAPTPETDSAIRSAADRLARTGASIDSRSPDPLKTRLDWFNPLGSDMGIQIVGQPWREDVVLAIAKYLKIEFGGWNPPAI